MRRLSHHYTLTEQSGTTLVTQRMDYDLKFGLVGALLDAMLVRRRWDQGIKTFFRGLKAYVESS